MARVEIHNSASMRQIGEIMWDVMLDRYREV